MACSKCYQIFLGCINTDFSSAVTRSYVDGEPVESDKKL